jgi:hypothetical protein
MQIAEGRKKEEEEEGEKKEKRGVHKTLTGNTWSMSFFIVPSKT